uniref:Uncharacterized protein n=1 Tax=Rhizophora mucronata TaxID=61149 RepID=A0A2P2K0G9_RHIMU
MRSFVAKRVMHRFINISSLFHLKYQTNSAQLCSLIANTNTD